MCACAGQGKSGGSCNDSPFLSIGKIYFFWTLIENTTLMFISWTLDRIQQPKGAAIRLQAWVVHTGSFRVLTLILCGKKKKNIVWHENCTLMRSKCSSAFSHRRSWLPPGILRCSWLQQGNRKGTNIQQTFQTCQVLPEPPMFLAGSVLFWVQPLDLVYKDKDLLSTV